MNPTHTVRFPAQAWNDSEHQGRYKLKVTHSTEAIAVVAKVCISSETGKSKWIEIPVASNDVTFKEFQDAQFTVQISYLGKESITVRVQKLRKEELPPLISPMPPDITADAVVLTDPMETMMTLKNAQQLVHLAKRTGFQDSSISKVVKEMAELFIGSPMPLGLEVMKEILLVVDLLDPYDRRRIIEKCIEGINTSVMSDTNLLHGLSEMLKSLQRLYYKIVVEQAGDNDSNGRLEEEAAALFKVYKANDFVQLLANLAGHLNSTSEAVDKEGLLNLPFQAQLESYVALLEIMEMQEVSRLERKKYHDICYQAIHRFHSHPDLKVAFFSAYGKQIFTLIPNDEADVHAFFRRTYHAVSSFKGILDAYHKKSLDPLVDTFHQLMKAFKFQDQEAAWFQTFHGFKHLFVVADTKYLTRFNELMSKEAEFATSIPTHHPFLLTGLVTVMQMSLEYHKGEEEVGIESLRLLEQIYLDNLEGTSPKKAVYKLEIPPSVYVNTTIKTASQMVKTGYDLDHSLGSYALQLKQQVAELIHDYSQQHLSSVVREKAILLKEKLRSQEPQLKFPPSFKQDHPTKMFEMARKNQIPWVESFQNIINELTLNEQLRQEADYYVPVAVQKVHSNEPAATLKDTLQVFLESTDRLLIIEGPGGSGKSFSIQLEAVRLMQNYSTDGYFPIVISLPTIRELHNFLNETLMDKGLMPFKSSLQTKKIIFFLDAFDEVIKQGKMKLYQFAGWTNAKVVVSCRTDFAGEAIESFRPSTRTLVPEIVICPFDTKKIETLLIRYLQVCRKQGVNTLWTHPEPYMQYLKQHPSLQEIVQQPLFAKIMADTLPHIEQRQQRMERSSVELTKTDLLDAFVCCLIARQENKRVKGNIKGDVEDFSRVEYLNYAVEMAQRIQQYSQKKNIIVEQGQTWVSLQEPMAKELFHDLFEDVLIPGKGARVKNLRHCWPITTNNGMWGFLHEEFYSYFITLGDRPDRRQEIEGRLTGDDYQFSEILLRAVQEDI